MSVRTFHISVPKDGEAQSGDAVVLREEDDHTLLTVLDALGHGAAAAAVAERGVAYLRGASIASSVESLMEGLHRALKGTRGAAAMICSVRGLEVQGCSVGNVDLRVTAGKVPVVLTPGILGVSLSRLRVFQGKVQHKARLFLFSDGVSPRMDFTLCEGLSTESACRMLMDRYRRGHDDASLLVADVEAVA